MDEMLVEYPIPYNPVDDASDAFDDVDAFDPAEAHRVIDTLLDMCTFDEEELSILESLGSSCVSDNSVGCDENDYDYDHDSDSDADTDADADADADYDLKCHERLGLPPVEELMDVNLTPIDVLRRLYKKYVGLPPYNRAGKGRKTRGELLTGIEAARGKPVVKRSRRRITHGWVPVTYVGNRRQGPAGVTPGTPGMAHGGQRRNNMWWTVRFRIDGKFEFRKVQVSALRFDA